VVGDRLGVDLDAVLADLKAVGAIDLPEPAVFRDGDPAFALVQIEVDHAIAERLEVIVAAAVGHPAADRARGDGRHPPIPKKPDQRLEAFAVLVLVAFDVL